MRTPPVLVSAWNWLGRLNDVLGRFKAAFLLAGGAAATLGVLSLTYGLLGSILIVVGLLSMAIGGLLWIRETRSKQAVSLEPEDVEPDGLAFFTVPELERQFSADLQEHVGYVEGEKPVDEREPVPRQRLLSLARSIDAWLKSPEIERWPPPGLGKGARGDVMHDAHRSMVRRGFKERFLPQFQAMVNDLTRRGRADPTLEAMFNGPDSYESATELVSALRAVALQEPSEVHEILEFELLPIIDGQEVLLRCTNVGKSEEVEIQVQEIEGTVERPSVPWTAKWQDSTTKHCLIRQGETRLLRLARLEYLNQEEPHDDWHRCIFHTITEPVVLHLPMESDALAGVHLRLLVASREQWADYVIRLGFESERPRAELGKRT